MDYLKRIIGRLHDPHLVASFQNYFGIRKTSYPGPPGKRPPEAREQSGGSDESTTPPWEPLDALEATTPNISYVKVGKRTLVQCQNGAKYLSSASDDEGSGSDVTESQTSSRIKNFFFKSMTAEGELTDSDTESKNYIVTRPVWHTIFLIGSALGDELFYATFFPLWFWNIDGAVGRRAVLVWLGIMYIGQALKDVMQIPRPACPPVVRVQKKWSLEYGFPSTHSMIGIAMPAALVIFTSERYEYPVLLGVLPAMAWCLSVCGSRLYLGMHSLLDVLVGLLLGVLILCCLILPTIDAIDLYLVTDTYAPVVLSLVIAGMVLLYPAGNTWTPARGDTVIICAVVLGVYSGAWMNYNKHLISAAQSSPPYQIIWPTYEMWGSVMARSSIGLCSVLATRAIFKSLSHATVCALLQLNRQDVSLRRANVTQKQFVTVELSYKFLTYAAVGFDIIYTAPLVFRLIGIERPEFYTEM